MPLTFGFCVGLDRGKPQPWRVHSINRHLGCCRGAIVLQGREAHRELFAPSRRRLGITWGKVKGSRTQAQQLTWCACARFSQPLLTFADIGGGPLRTVGDHLPRGHWHLLPDLGIWVQTSPLRGDLDSRNKPQECFTQDSCSNAGASGETFQQTSILTAETSVLGVSQTF